MEGTATAPDISLEDVQESLMLSVLAMECIHGTARASLELSHKFDPTKRICTIDASTALGRDLNCLFGRKAFSVQRSGQGVML